MNSTPYPGAQAITRAVTLLKHFSDSQPEWRLAELAREVKLNKTTTYRLLAALESEGLIMRSVAHDSYRLGPELIALGGRALRSNDLRTISHTELATLAQATQETATLEVWRDQEMLVLDEVLGQHLISTVPSMGMRWPLHATSTGKAVLAYLSDEARAAALPRRLATPTDKTIRDRETLFAELARIRARGYAVAQEELEENYVAVGAPIFNHEGQVIAAISLGGLNTRLKAQRVNELAPRVKEAAARISYQLGYRK